MVACYDWRTTPGVDVGSDGPHLQRAQELVEAAYTNSGGLPVYLVGHSNGPLYALALVRAMSAEWRQKYIGEPLPLAWGRLLHLLASLMGISHLHCWQVFRQPAFRCPTCSLISCKACQSKILQPVWCMPEQTGHSHSVLHQTPADKHD